MSSTEQKVKKVLIIILFVNWAVALVKIILGNAIGSGSVTADGFHSLSDGFSNVVGLIGIYLASRPKDEQHPYGHKRYENITGLFIGVVLAFFSFNIIKHAVTAFQNPVKPDISMESLYVLLATLLLNIAVAYIEYKKGLELNSDILIADSLHTKSDIFVTFGVIVTLIAIYFGAPPIIDSIISILVALAILFAAFGIVKKTGNILLDAVAVDVVKVKDFVLQFPEVKDVHAIRSRRSGNVIYIDMHILVDPDMNVKQTHDLVHLIEQKLRDKIDENIQTIIHTEPFNNKS